MTWSFRSVTGEGKQPAQVDGFGGTLLIVGGGRCVFDDLQKFCGAGDGILNGVRRWQGEEGNDVCAVNDIGVNMTVPLAHWASLHSNRLHHWAALRKLEGLPSEGLQLHTDLRRGVSTIKNEWSSVPNFGGLSGLFAMIIGVLMGYDMVVLAGVPTDGNGRFYDPPDSGGVHGERSIIGAWEEAMNCYPDMASYCRSMSGYTCEILGGP